MIHSWKKGAILVDINDKNKGCENEAKKEGYLG